MTIDSLTHVTPDGRWFNTDHDAGVERLLREMDRAGVEQSVVVALAGYIDNDFVYETCQKSGGRFVPGASLDPCAHVSPEKAAEAAQALLGGGDFPVLKLHPRLNGYDPLDPRCLAVLEAVQSLDGRVGVWLDSIFRNGRCLLSKPPVDTVQTLLQTFPGLDFVLLHGGGPLLLQMAELLTGHPNLTLDISLTLNYYARTSLSLDIDYLLDKRERCLCAGSDFPEYTPSDYLELLRGKAHALGLPPEDLLRVEHGNVAGILEKRGGA